MPAPLSVHVRPASAVGNWESEVDVVVVGGGAAGVCAALEAAALGAEVVVLERTSGLGGVSALSGGLVYLGGGTSLQKACGFEDSVDAMYDFLSAATGPGADLAKLAVYCEGSPEHFDWLVDQGVPFKASFYGGLRAEPPGDDGLMFSGGEKGYPWADLARPAPRAHVPQLEGRVHAERGGGWKLMTCLVGAVESSPIKVRCDVSAERLVTQSDGRIVGVVVRHFGEEEVFGARSGVVLATGGFIFNDDMLAEHAPHLLGQNKIGTDVHDGRGILMGQAAGAATRHMDAAVAYGVGTPLLVRSVLVNARGHRFINEDTYFGRVGITTLAHHGGDSILIIDQEGYESVPDIDRAGFAVTAACETLAELETELGVPAGALESTVELYNRHAERGEDPLFHKAPDWLKPLRPPFGAIDLRQGLQPGGVGPATPSQFRFNAFTLGGLRTSADAEVMDLNGEAIPGLYAAGRTTSGVPAVGYMSGTSLGDGTFFGRRAGRTAVKAAP